MEAAIGAVLSALAENAATVALVAGATTAAGSIYQAQQSNSAAAKQRNIATQRAQIEQAGADAKYRQDRSLINRRLAQQIDAARVAGGASGVSGGASALVLESAYGQQANTDLAIASANRARGGMVIGANLANENARADSMRQNVFAAAVSGVAQGVSMYNGITGMGSRAGAGAAPEVNTIAQDGYDWTGGNTGGTYGSPLA